MKKIKPIKVIVCGGGRKNKHLISKIKNYNLTGLSIQSIDELGIKWRFYRVPSFCIFSDKISKLSFPISFPSTTGCKEPISRR